MDNKVDKIPELSKTVDVITAKGIVDIDAITSDRGVAEIKKQELIRDVAISTVGKIQGLWDALQLSTSDEKTLTKYASYFVKPVASIMDIARKANVDVYEMKYGKKVQVAGGVEKFDDFIKRKLAENKKSNEIIEAKVVSDGDGSTKEDN